MAEIKYLANLDLSKNQLLNAVVQNLAVAPTSPVQGQIYWSTADDTLYVWNEDGSAWIDLGSDGITNLGYTAGTSNGIVTSDSGSNATIPLADGTNAGLMSAAEKSKLANIEANAKNDQSASEVSSSASGNLAATNVQSALEELQGDIDSLGAASNNLSKTQSSTTEIDIDIENGTGITLDAATGSIAGVMTAADKTKLDGIDSGAEVNVATNLAEGTTTNTTVVVTSSTGTNATLGSASTTRAGLLSKAKFDEIAANTLKVSDVNHNVSTNLSVDSITATTLDIASSDGTDATIPAATTDDAGLLTAAKFDEIAANTLKVSDVNHNVSTNLSEGTVTNTTVNVNSSDGTNATLAAASTTRAGVMSKAKFDEVTANTLKNTNVSTNISVVENATTVSINSSDGTDDTIAAVTGTKAGVMLPAQKTKLDGIAAGAQVNVAETVTSISLASNTLTYTDENGTDTDIDLSLYLDDTNLARLTSGSINGSTGIATFTRDDSSTFTIDMSAFLDAITLNNTLTSTSTTEGLTANQGKVLKDLIDGLNVGTGTNTGDEPDASTTVKGVIEIATNTETNAGTLTNRAVTPANLKNLLGYTGSLSTTLKYTATVGNGTLTSIVVNHAIGSQHVSTQVFDASSDDLVMCEVENTDANNVTLKFNVAPTSNQYRVVIIG